MDHQPPATPPTTTSPPTATDPAGRLPSAGVGADESIWTGTMRPTTVGATALVSVFAFEAMAVTTAMPVVAAALDGLALYGLAFGAAVAASVVGMVVAGIACDRRGPLAPFVGGVALFVMGLLLAGLAPTMAVVVAGRAVQGLGVGMAIVTLYVLVDAYPDHLQPKVFAAFAAAWVVPALVGPALAGVLAEQWHWRAVFLLVIAFALPGAVLVLQRMRRREATVVVAPWTAGDRRRSIAAVAAATGAGALHLAGQAEGWRAAALLVLGLVAIAASVRHLLPRGTLRLRRGLPAVIGLRGVAASGFFAAEVLLPLMLTTQRGFATGTAGVVLTGGAIGWSAGSWAQGRFERPPATWLRRGFTAVTVGIALVATALVPTAPIALAIGGWLLAGTGMGLAIPTLSVQVLRLSPRHEQGGNVSSLQVADALASGTCLAAVGTLVAIGGAQPSTFAAGLALATALTAVGVVMARRSRPA